jgi:hypothetical protein
MRTAFLSASVILAFAAATPPGRTPTPTPSPIDAVAETPTPVPPEPSRRLVAALDVKQGDGGERTAVFEDGTLVRVIRLGDRTTTSRRTLAKEELAVVSRVVAEALAVEEGEQRSFVLVEEGRRKMRLEIGDGAKVKEFDFDDASTLPLPVGRARAALEDLRARFIVKPVDKPDMWSPSDVKPGDLLRRRGSGHWFRVVRDDSFENNLEVLEVGTSGMRQFVRREDLPKIFEDPDSIDPTEVPR